MHIRGVNKKTRKNETRTTRDNNMILTKQKIEAK